MNEKFHYRQVIILLFGVFITFIIPLAAKLVSPWLLILTPVLVVYWIWGIKHLFYYLKYQLNESMSDCKESCRDEIVGCIRQIRHKQINHFQIAYSLAQLSQDHRLLKNMEIIKDHNQVYGEIIKINNYELFIFFLKQYIHGIEKNHNFHFKNNVDLRLKPKQGEQVTTFLTQLCNLIDLLGQDKFQAEIEWTLSENNDCYIIDFKIITNQRPWENLPERAWKDLDNCAHESQLKFKCIDSGDQFQAQLSILKLT